MCYPFVWCRRDVEVEVVVQISIMEDDNKYTSGWVRVWGVEDTNTKRLYEPAD